MDNNINNGIPNLNSTPVPNPIPTPTPTPAPLNNADLIQNNQSTTSIPSSSELNAQNTINNNAFETFESINNSQPQQVSSQSFQTSIGQPTSISNSSEPIVQNTINNNVSETFENINNSQPQQVSSQNLQTNIEQPTSMQSSNVNLQSSMEQINPTIQQNTNYQNEFTNQQPTDSNINDEELLKSFIGKNYDKITTRPFNFAGFFFTTFYMFYRKMFLYGILLFLVNLVILNVINKFIITILFNVAVGFLVNKVYLYYAKKKIEKIKSQNSGKDLNAIKEICVSKGGTSVGKIFLGFLAEIGIAFVVLFVMLIAGIGGVISEMVNPNNWNITINGNKINTNNSDSNNSDSNKNKTLVEDVVVDGYACFGSNCSITIEKDNTSTDYELGINNSELFKKLDDYKEYVKVNIYYIQKGNKKTIVDYKIFVKSNNEDISSVSTESELRDKIGLYSIGTHTDSFTLKEIGTLGFGYQDDNSYTYIDYTFVDNKNNEYEMKYKNPDNSLNLTEGNKYNVTFEVVKGTFDYEFNIKTIN